MNIHGAALVAGTITKSCKQVDVLKGSDLLVPRGMVPALPGPNGADTTTMARMLATLRKPDSDLIRHRTVP